MRKSRIWKDWSITPTWFPAQRKGYSGAAILSKEEPKHIEFGTGIGYTDEEGRVLKAIYDDFSFISVYVPSGTNMEKRLDFKMQFCHDFLDYIKNLRKEIPNLIISGDYNICLETIDIHVPVRNAKVSGFLVMEREWMNDYLDKCNLIDSFRYFVKDSHKYSWWSYRANARAKNKGWRIDYHMVSKPMQPRMKRAAILPEAKHSDHCPILVKID